MSTSIADPRLRPASPSPLLPESMLSPAYCISLASKPERRAFCKQQFDAEGLDVAFFDGIVVKDKGQFPSIGTLGCYLSHRAVIEKALNDTPPERLATTNVTIFEDDVLLPRGFGQIVKTVLPKLEGIDWHIFYWGMENTPPLTPVRGHEPLMAIAPEHTIIGKQAYTVRLATARPLLDYLYYCETHHPSYSDGMFHQYRMLHSLAAHTHTLKPARQASFTSNLTPRLGGSWIHNRLRALKRRWQLATR